MGFASVKTVKALEQTLIEQLVGRGSLSDVDFVADLGIDYPTFETTMTKLVQEHRVRVVNSDPEAETVYELVDKSGIAQHHEPGRLA